MPPPPRRRRPVQPATRVRLPRTARPRTGPSTAQPQDTPETGTGPEAAPTDLLTDDPVREKTSPAGDDPAPAADVTAGQVTAQDATAETRAADDEEAGAADAGAAEASTRDTSAGEAGAADAGAAEASARDASARETGARGGVAAGAGAGEHVREPLLLPVCLGIVAVALGGLAVWFGLNSSGTPAPASGFGAGTANRAVIDRAATAQVTRQIDTAVDTIFSYNYADTAKTAQAAQSLLTGRAKVQYATLFKVIEQQAPAEKLVVTTTVTNSGVEMLTGNTARLLVFANQKDTGAAKGSTTEAGAMFAVTAVRQGGRWKIASIDTFTSPG